MKQTRYIFSLMGIFMARAYAMDCIELCVLIKQQKSSPCVSDQQKNSKSDTPSPSKETLWQLLCCTTPKQPEDSLPQSSSYACTPNRLILPPTRQDMP